jgi:hypothetical protein
MCNGRKIRRRPTGNMEKHDDLYASKVVLQKEDLHASEVVLQEEDLDAPEVKLKQEVVTNDDELEVLSDGLYFNAQI